MKAILLAVPFLFVSDVPTPGTPDNVVVKAAWRDTSDQVVNNTALAIRPRNGFMLNLVKNQSGRDEIEIMTSALSGDCMRDPGGTVLTCPGITTNAASIAALQSQVDALTAAFASLAYGATGASGPCSDCVGYVIESVVAKASPVTVTLTGAKTITQVNLPPGHWDVTGTCDEFGAAVAGVNFACAIGTTINVMPATSTIGDTRADTILGGLIGGDNTQQTPTKRFNVTTLTPVYVTGQVGLALGTASLAGKLRAVRVP